MPLRFEVMLPTSAPCFFLNEELYIEMMENGSMEMARKIRGCTNVNESQIALYLRIVGGVGGCAPTHIPAPLVSPVSPSEKLFNP
jgi:hypothetical protein